MRSYCRIIGRFRVWEGFSIACAATTEGVCGPRIGACFCMRGRSERVRTISAASRTATGFNYLKISRCITVAARLCQLVDKMRTTRLLAGSSREIEKLSENRFDY